MIVEPRIDEPLIGSTSSERADETNVEAQPSVKAKQLVYFVKNASHMPVESVLSAVFGVPGSQTTGKQSSSSPKKKTSLIGAKKRLSDQRSQKVVIKGSDGKENMIFLDLPVPIKMEVPEGSEDVDDPAWTPSNVDHQYIVGNTRPSAHWSKLKRARNAVRNSVRTLRLPKPHRIRESTRERRSNKPGRKQLPISEDDPNYAVMMEKFAKPVSLSTLKRHGLYQPKSNSYKINAPYKKDVAPYIEKLSDTEYKCKICLTAKFRWNYKAEIHILEHLDWRPFECDVCGRAFTQNQYLRKHKRLHFPDETTFICEVCGKGFQRRYYLTYHMDEHFDRTYTCQECGREFSLRQKHDEHVRYHHKCNYSVCDVCGQTLRTTALSRHRKHHMDKNQPRKRREKAGSSGTPRIAWVSCDICGRAFRSQSARDHHVEDHSNAELPFHCEECAVYFKTRRSLNDHTLHVHSHVAEDESQMAAHVLDQLASDVVVTITEEI